MSDIPRIPAAEELKSRIMSEGAKESGGHIQKGSFEALAQSAIDRAEAAMMAGGVGQVEFTSTITVEEVEERVSMLQQAPRQRGYSE